MDTGAHSDRSNQAMLAPTKANEKQPRVHTHTHESSGNDDETETRDQTSDMKKVTTLIRCLAEKANIRKDHITESTSHASLEPLMPVTSNCQKPCPPTAHKTPQEREKMIQEHVRKRIESGREKLSAILQTASTGEITLLEERGENQERLWYLRLAPRTSSLTNPSESLFSLSASFAEDLVYTFTLRGRTNTKEAFRVRIDVTQKGQIRGKIFRANRGCRYGPPVPCFVYLAIPDGSEN